LDDTVPAALASTDYSSQDGSDESGPEAHQPHDEPRLSSVAAAAEHRAGIVVGMSGSVDSDASDAGDALGPSTE
jgi:predicted amidohydrolase